MTSSTPLPWGSDLEAYAAAVLHDCPLLIKSATTQLHGFRLNFSQHTGRSGALHLLHSGTLYDALLLDSATNTHYSTSLISPSTPPVSSSDADHNTSPLPRISHSTRPRRVSRPPAFICQNYVASGRPQPKPPLAHLTLFQAFRLRQLVLLLSPSFRLFWTRGDLSAVLAAPKPALLLIFSLSLLALYLSFAVTRIAVPMLQLMSSVSSSVTERGIYYHNVPHSFLLKNPHSAFQRPKIFHIPHPFHIPKSQSTL
jgi:hypothetical protein